MKIKVTTSFVNDQMKLPAYARTDDAAMDLQANNTKEFALLPGDTVPIDTGIAIALPSLGTKDQKWVFDIRPRSGLAANRGLTVLNAPGTVDQGYRGPIKVLLHNAGKHPVVITPGMRIAQLMLTKAFEVEWEEVETLDVTERNTGGMGHSGV